MDDKQVLHYYLKRWRIDLRGKIDGLSEYQIRHPMTMTGTNLLGLIKHVGGVQLWYFGQCFDRPSARDNLPWMALDAEENADMWATETESTAEILDFWDFSAAHADATIEELDVHTVGEVP